MALADFVVGFVRRAQGVHASLGSYTVIGVQRAMGDDGNKVVGGRSSGPPSTEFHSTSVSRCRSLTKQSSLLRGSSELSRWPRITMLIRFGTAMARAGPLYAEIQTAYRLLDGNARLRSAVTVQLNL